MSETSKKNDVEAEMNVNVDNPVEPTSDERRANENGDSLHQASDDQQNDVKQNSNVVRNLF
jgi:hypothetical protein